MNVILFLLNIPGFEQFSSLGVCEYYSLHLSLCTGEKQEQRSQNSASVLSRGNGFKKIVCSYISYLCSPNYLDVFALDRKRMSCYFKLLSNMIFLISGINHGDLNDHNILVDSKSASGDAVYQVSGILDFGDMSYGYYVFEVAITIMYMMIESTNPLQVGGHILAGFESVIPLTAVERSALFVLVCSRFSQSLVMAAYSCQLYPDNKEYLMITAKTGWQHLQQLFDMGQKAVEEIWFETAKSYESRISV